MTASEAIRQVDDKVSAHGYSSLAAHERVVFNVATLQADTGMEGLYDYVWGIDNLGQIRDCAQDLKQIGADRVAFMLENLLEIIGDSNPQDLSGLQVRQIDRLSHKYEDLVEDLHNKFEEFLKSNFPD